MSVIIIQEGDLEAFIQGSASPEIITEINNSPEYQKKIEELCQVDQYLSGLFAEVKPLNSQDLVDVASGQATATQKLIVAAHCRKDPTIQAQLTALEASWQQMVAEDEKAENRSWHIPPIKLPIFIAVPLLSGALARSSTRSIQAQSIGPQNYRVEELQADVTLRVARVEGEVWQIMGSVTQHDSLVAEAKVTLHSEESHPRPRITDEDGFFVFSRLWEGSCTLRIRLPDGIVEIPDIQLMDEDDLLL